MQQVFHHYLIFKLILDITDALRALAFTEATKAISIALVAFPLVNQVIVAAVYPKRDTPGDAGVERGTIVARQ